MTERMLLLYILKSDVGQATNMVLSLKYGPEYLGLRLQSGDR